MPYPKLKEERYSNFQGVNQKASKYITGPNQALSLTNLDLSTIGSLTKRPGTTQYIGSTLSGRIGAFYEFEKLDGSSYVITAANTNAYKVVGNSFSAIRSGLTDSGIFDFVTFVDRLFATNGSEFWKFDGVNSTYYSLPPGATPSAVIPIGVGGVSGLLQYAWGWLNDAGYYGPATNFIDVSASGVGSLAVLPPSPPIGYGLSAAVLYRGYSGGPYFPIQQVTPNGFVAGNDSGQDPIFDFEAPDYLWFTMAPQSIELYNNQLFLIGFSGALSTFYYSDIGNPEGILPESFNEVRTNDGDFLTAGKAYYSQLVLTKNRSIHALAGEDPLNFSLREISDQYGCISKRAIVVWEQICWMLDEKGICEFDGSNVDIVSNQVEPIFRSMNLPVARELAQMIHVKDRNEVWTAIPCNGASFLNCVVHYDYLAKGWWVSEGVNTSAMNVFQGYLEKRTVGFGDFSGALNYFGASFFNDNGRGMTCSVRFPFSSNQEHSTEHFWRRLWLDLDPTVGVTKTITVNFYTNQGNSAVLTRTIVQSEFQNRIDYGISSKDLSPEFIFAADSPLRLNGYTLAHRFQRDV